MMKTADKEKLWDAYRQKKTQETREQLIIEYAQLVNRSGKTQHVSWTQCGI